MTVEAHDLVAAYVLDALGEFERSRFVAHLATCPDCRLELTRLEAASLRLDDLGS